MSSRSASFSIKASAGRQAGHRFTLFIRKQWSKDSGEPTHVIVSSGFLHPRPNVSSAVFWRLLGSGERAHVPKRLQKLKHDRSVQAKQGET